MGLILLLTWVVFTVFGVTSTQKVSKTFRYSHNSPISGVTPEKEVFKLPVSGVKITPPPPRGTRTRNVDLNYNNCGCLSMLKMENVSLTLAFIH